MKIEHVGRNEFVTEIPVLTQVGEEFVLSGNQFSKGSIGRIVKIMSQSSGMTRARFKFVKGGIKDGSLTMGRSRGNKVEDREGNADDFNKDEGGLPVGELKTRAQIFEETGGRLHKEAGGSPLYEDFDPRPRRGEDSVPIDSAEAPRGWDSMAPIEIMPVAVSIADVRSHPRGGASDFLSSEELAQQMGRAISKKSGVSGGRRGSFSNANVGELVRQVIAENPDKKSS